MRKLLSVVVLWLSLSLVVAGGAIAEAQSCGAIGGSGPKTYTTATFNQLWWYFSFTAAQKPVAHIGQNDGPNAPVYGTHWSCSAYLGNYGSIIWYSTVSLTNNEICIFQTNGGLTCQIRGSDGLPVELMDFTVE